MESKGFSGQQVTVAGIFWMGYRYPKGTHNFQIHFKVILPLCPASFKDTSGFATTHVVVFLLVSNPSYHLLISQSPTNLANTLTIHTGENIKIDRQGRQYTCLPTIHAIFLLTVRRIRMFFSLKPYPSQGESCLKISARRGSPFRRSSGTSKHTDSLTDRVIKKPLHFMEISWAFTIHFP